MKLLTFKTNKGITPIEFVRVETGSPLPDMLRMHPVRKGAEKHFNNSMAKGASGIYGTHKDTHAACFTN